MNTSKSPQIIFDHIWQPLVLVPSEHRAFLVHPGTTMKPVELTAGWHWHWPLLTSIIQVSGETFDFYFYRQRPSHPYYDEPITGVSRDHHLFTSQGRFRLRIDTTASAEVLYILNRHAIRRLIRPTIRQIMRQSISRFEAASISQENVASTALSLATPMLAKHGLLVHDLDLFSLEHYQPQVRK